MNKSIFIVDHLILDTDYIKFNNLDKLTTQTYAFNDMNDAKVKRKELILQYIDKYGSYLFEYGENEDLEKYFKDYEHLKTKYNNDDKILESIYERLMKYIHFKHIIKIIITELK
jgi:hypothetical protein